jgi:hypothetical protein
VQVKIDEQEENLALDLLGASGSRTNQAIVGSRSTETSLTTGDQVVPTLQVVTLTDQVKVTITLQGLRT